MGSPVESYMALSATITLISFIISYHLLIDHLKFVSKVVFIGIFIFFMAIYTYSYHKVKIYVNSKIEVRE